MNSGGFPYLLFAVLTFLLYFISRAMIVEFYYFLHLLTRNRNLVFSLLAIFFLPGTILHEMSHFLAAIVLFLPVGEIRIMPEWEKNHLELGRVTYGKKDFIRGILVGIAPFFGALSFFWFLGAFHLFPLENVVLNILVGYLIFTVSSNMFSSKQDLIDLIYIIPLGLIIGAVFYITKLNISIPGYFIKNIGELLQRVNFYITISLVIHIAVIVLFKSLRLVFKR